LTVVQAAASRSTLVALIIAVACGAVVLVPSLALLFTLYLRGRLDTPEQVAPPGPTPADFAAGPASSPAIGLTVGAVGAASAGHDARASPPGTRVRAWGLAAAAGLVGGTGLLVFANASWAHLVGVACLVLCAVAVFLLAAPGDA
jgi:cytochrome d ubiquinol oxidase subunit II